MSLPIRPPPLMSLFVYPSVAAFVSPTYTQSLFSSASLFSSPDLCSPPVSTACDTPPSNSPSPTPQSFPRHTPPRSSSLSPSPIPIVQSLISWLVTFLFSGFLNHCAPPCVTRTPCSTPSTFVPYHSCTPHKHGVKCFWLSPFRLKMVFRLLLHEEITLLVRFSAFYLNLI